MAEGYVETNGVRLWFDDRGDPAGTPVVLVNGAMSTAISWPPALPGALVAAGCRVVTFDHRDIGLSTHVGHGGAPYGLGDLVADTLGLLDALGIDAAHLVGQSMGGVISQVLAIDHPDRVRSLTLLNTTPGPDDRLSPPEAGLFAAFARPPETDDERREVMVAFGRALSGSRFGFDEESFRALLAADDARGTNPDSRHGLVPSSASSRVDALANVRVPTLVIHGTEDPLYPFDHAEVMAKAVPGAILVTWEGVGHELPAPLAPQLADLLVRQMGAA